MRNALALGGVSFLICKLSFAVLSWFVDEKKTAFDWQQPELSHFLHHCVQRLRESFFSRPFGLSMLLGGSLIYHLLCFLPGLELLALLESVVFEIPYRAGDGLWQFLYLDPHSRLWPWSVYAGIALGGVGYDIVSGFVSWTLLKAADRARSGLLGFLILNGLFFVVVGGGYGYGVLTVVSISLPRALDYRDIVLVTPQVISVSIPILASGGIGFALLAIRWLPLGVRAWLFSRPSSRRNEPRLPLLGTGLGTIVALLVGIVTLMMA